MTEAAGQPATATEVTEGAIQALLGALLAPDPAPRLTTLRPRLTGELGALADAAIARLALRVPDPGTPEAALLQAVAGHPGLSLAELRDVAGLADVRAAADTLLRAGLVSDRRFERADCWSRTEAGAQALRRLVP